MDSGEVESALARGEENYIVRSGKCVERRSV